MLANRLLPTLAIAASLFLALGCSKPASDKDTATAADTVAVAVVPESLPRTPSAAGASVFFISPSDGDVVSSPVTVEFGIAAMSIVRAGEIQANSGHHHLLIDTDIPDLTMPVPADEHHRHFGDASTTAYINLEPGPHTLRLLLADYRHIPHAPPVMSDTITITVE